MSSGISERYACGGRAGFIAGAIYPDAAPDAIAPQERGRAALAAIPPARSSPLDTAGCALASAYAERESCDRRVQVGIGSRRNGSVGRERAVGVVLLVASGGGQKMLSRSTSATARSRCRSLGPT